jgi:hypothetical protein
MIRIEDYVDVYARADDLGCRRPSGLAFLPRGFADALERDELADESPVRTLRVLWRQAGLVDVRIEPDGERFPTVKENAFEWAGPIIFVAASLVSQNPNAVSIALGVVSNYVTEFFRGVGGPKKARLDIVVEKTSEQGSIFKRVHFEGGPEELQHVADVVREVMQSDG